MSTKVTTGKVLFMYPNLLQPRTMKQDPNDPRPPKQRYSVLLVIPKDDEGKKTIANLAEAIKAEQEIGKAKYWGGQVPIDFMSPIKDADSTTDVKVMKFVTKNESLKGHWYVNAATNAENGKPYVVEGTPDGKVKTVNGQVVNIETADGIYAGCFGRASLNAGVYSNNGNEGVSLYLNGIVVTEKGERLAGAGSSADSDFETEDSAPSNDPSGGDFTGII